MTDDTQADAEGSELASSNDAPTSDSDDIRPADGGGSAHRTRGALSTAFVVLATVLAIVATLTTWVKTQALDTDAWVDVSDQLLQEPEVTDALAVFIVDQVYETVDVSSEIENALPEDLEGLGSIAAAALRDPATSGVKRLVSSDQFAAVWSTVNRTAHQALVNILRDETRTGVSTTDGNVTLELGELVKLTATNLGLSGDRLDQLPDDAGSIVIFSSDELASVQSAVQVLDFMSWFLFVVVVALYAAAVFLATGWRARALRNVGISLVAVGVIVLLARSVGVRVLVDAVVGDRGNQALGQVVANTATNLISHSGWTAIMCGLVVTAFAWLFGDSKRSSSARRATAPLTNSSTAALAAGAAILLLVIWWWNPGGVFDRAITGWTIAILLAGAVVALAIRNRREFPEVTFSDVSTPIMSRFGSDSDSASEPTPPS